MEQEPCIYWVLLIMINWVLHSTLSCGCYFKNELFLKSFFTWTHQPRTEVWANAKSVVVMILPKHQEVRPKTCHSKEPTIRRCCIFSIIWSQSVKIGKWSRLCRGGPTSIWAQPTRTKTWYVKKVQDHSIHFVVPCRSIYFTFIPTYIFRLTSSIKVVKSM